jgi:hypothetical protein
MNKKVVLFAVVLISGIAIIIGCNKNRGNNTTSSTKTQNSKLMSDPEPDSLTNIGYVDSTTGSFVITGNMANLAGVWETILYDSLKISTTLDTFKIVSGVDSGDSNKTYYTLIGSDRSHDNVAVEVFRTGNSFYFQQIFSTTVTCTGCSTGCDPGKFRSVYYCTGGCGNNCTKTVTRTFEHYISFVY